LAFWTSILLPIRLVLVAGDNAHPLDAIVRWSGATARLERRGSGTDNIITVGPGRAIPPALEPGRAVASGRYRPLYYPLLVVLIRREKIDVADADVIVGWMLYPIVGALVSVRERKN
jgi:hypothetical protein